MMMAPVLHFMSMGSASLNQSVAAFSSPPPFLTVAPIRALLAASASSSTVSALELSPLELSRLSKSSLDWPCEASPAQDESGSMTPSCSRMAS